MSEQNIIKTKSTQLLKNILIIVSILSLLLIGSGIFYYYVIFSPQLERDKLNLEKQQIEQKQKDEIAAKKASDELLERKQQQEEEYEQQRVIKYKDCMTNNQRVYTDNWAQSCQRVAQTNQVDLDNCLNNSMIMNNEFMGKSYCMKMYGSTKYDPNCSLPRKIADDIGQYRKDADAKCLTEAQNKL